MQHCVGYKQNTRMHNLNSLIQTTQCQIYLTKKKQQQQQKE
jgi:hypothetical protein